MNSDFFSRLNNYVIKFNVKKILLIEIDDVSIIEIEQLAKYTEKVCVATEHFFLRRQLTTRFMNNSHVEIFPTHSIKTYDYDAIVCSEIVSIILPIINSIPTIKYIFTKFLDIDSVKNFIKLDDIALIKLSEDNRLTNLIDKNDEVNEVDEVNETTIVNMPQKITENIDVKSNDGAKLKCSFFTVNYNTSKLINILIKSIHKFVKSIDYDIWVFDNSDKEQLVLEKPWEDVHILDNTKGQLVNYQKLLAEYTDEKNTSWTAGFISLKHVLAIDYGLNYDMISDNFILCDSDIIILKDLDFIDASFMTIGYARSKHADVIRIVPFLNYINRALMREYKISYFDHYRFHGCIMKNGKTMSGHDTGGSFYLDIMEKCPELFKSIDLDEYIIHLGGQSRNDKYARKLNLNVDELVEKLKLNDSEDASDFSYSGIAYMPPRYDFSNLEGPYESLKKAYEITKPHAKNVIYTAIIGEYDKIKDLSFYDFENFDYICFTNSKNTKSDNWKIIDISDLNKYVKINDNTKEARFIKTHPHLFFKKYERSIWIDANVDVKCQNLSYEFLPLLDKDDYLMTMQHPFLDDVYAEYDKILALKKETPEVLKKIRDFLKYDGFNDKGRHVQTNIILRDHNNPDCIRLMEKWWSMILKWSRRDQMTFNYVFERFYGRFTVVPAKMMTDRFFYICSNHAVIKKY